MWFDELDYAAGHSVWTTLEMHPLGRIVPGIEVLDSFKITTLLIIFFKPALVGYETDWEKRGGGGDPVTFFVFF